MVEILAGVMLLMGVMPARVVLAEERSSSAGSAGDSAALSTAAAEGSSAVPTAAGQNPAHPGVTVIVLDPGHGGTEGQDLGAQYAPYYEKEMTLAVANHMRWELSFYDNVEVYLTREEDRPVSLKERVDYASAVNADFLFSIHFNARAEHDLYGSEILASAFGNAYETAATFGNLELQQLTLLGLYPRGISTRLNGSGTEDYYGIINRAAKAGIPAVITEHCFLDHPVDRAFLAQENALPLLAHADVVALAAYLHLKSTALGVDFSQFSYPVIHTPASGIAGPDTTPPELNVITSAVYDNAAGQTTVQYEAEDSGSPIVYYQYSLDNGQSWSERLPFDRTKKEQTVTVPGKAGQSVCIRVENLYKYYTTSAPVLIR